MAGTRTGVNATELIELDELLPGDLEFVIEGQSYLTPGDVPVPTMLALMRAFQAVQDVQALPGVEPAEMAAQGEAIEAAILGLHAQVVALLRLRQPDLPDDALALGPNALVQITLTVMKKMGATVPEQEAPEPARPTRSGTTRRSTSKPKPKTRPRR